MSGAQVSVTELVAGARPPLLAVDFAAFSAAETLSTLLSRAATRRGVHRIDPMECACVEDNDLGWLARRYAGEVIGSGLRPAVVVGGCSSAVLALLLAEALVAMGQPPTPVVLVEPTWVSTQTIQAELTALRSGLGVPDSGPDLPRPLSTRAIAELLRRDIVAALRADGLRDDEVHDAAELLVQRYRRWFAFLVATVHTPIPTPIQPVPLLISVDGGAGPPAGWRADLVTRHELPLSTEEVLTSEVTLTRLLAVVDELVGHDRRVLEDR